MTGEELNRKYHELCGAYIRTEPDIDDDYRATTKHTLYLGNHTKVDSVWSRSESEQKWLYKKLPPFHLDANLAIAEATRVFAWYRLAIEPTRAVFIRLEIAVEGTTLCEAILKALIAAKEGAKR